MIASGVVVFRVQLTAWVGRKPAAWGQALGLAVVPGGT
jgi:hypothetical protein